MKTVRWSKSGFTLTELLIALGIIVVLTLIGIPAVEPMIKVKGVDAGSDVVRGALMFSRYSAVAEGKPGICRIVEGSVFESGAVTDSAANGPPVATPVDIYIDELDPGCSKSAGWVNFDDGAAYAGHGQYNNATGCTYTWNFTLPAGTGNLTVRACWIPSSNRTVTAQYTIATADGQTVNSSTFSQYAGSGLQWQTVYTGAFTGGAVRSVTAKKNDSGFLIADAVRITGTLNAGCPANTFKDTNKTWVDDVWNGYEVVWVSKTTGNSYTRPVSDVTEQKKVVVSTDWSPYPEVGAPYLIRQAVSSALEKPVSVGSGPVTSARWDRLPQGVGVATNRINDDGSESTTAAFPILFNSSGRALGSGSYITIRVYDKERPTEKTLWRYVRLYRNTGRVYTARTIAELP